MDDAIVGKNSHVGAEAVLAGVVRAAGGAVRVIDENVLIGANAVVIEGVQIGSSFCCRSRCRVLMFQALW